MFDKYVAKAAAASGSASGSTGALNKGETATSLASLTARVPALECKDNIKSPTSIKSEENSGFTVKLTCFSFIIFISQSLWELVS